MGEPEVEYGAPVVDVGTFVVVEYDGSLLPNSVDDGLALVVGEANDWLGSVVGV
jgi:hypothetical protein